MTPSLPDSIPTPNSGTYPSPPATEKFISFELAGCGYCVNASAVAEVVSPLAITSLPEGPEWLLGLAAHRGEIVAVIDPKTIDSSAPSELSGAKAKLMIFRPLPEGTQFALPVAAILELFSAGPSDFNPSHGSKPFRPAVVDRENVRLTLLDHSLVFQSFFEEQTLA